MGMLRRLAWDVVDDCADVNRSQNHADAVIESLGLTGVLERVNAIDHHRRNNPAALFAEELVDRVDEQLSAAIARLKVALAEPAPASN